ncbi:hypothetical protein [Neomoorella mulderi]|uniref:hypothetical protein n=1 Tax=Neomoorella mulderi TaxID=202604 RepID=UPI001372E967|nr:hypothetical protein [Moorella mulderi]
MTLEKPGNTHQGEPWDTRAWVEEKRFIQIRIKQGPVEGKRTWGREDLYDRGYPGKRCR